MSRHHSSSPYRLLRRALVVAGMAFIFGWVGMGFGCNGASSTSTGLAGRETGSILLEVATKAVHVMGSGLASPLGLTPGGPVGLVIAPVCQGGGSVTLNDSCDVTETSLFGKTYGCSGQANFSNCGPSRLNGLLLFTAQIGPVPLSCNLHNLHGCSSPVPLVMGLVTPEGGSFLIGDAAVANLRGLFAGTILNGVITGEFTMLEGIVDGQHCASAGGATPVCGSAADMDGDGVPDVADNCPNVRNASQTDDDDDGFGDVCDNCPPTTSQGSETSTANPDQMDTDGDQLGNACDPCPDAAGIDCPEPVVPGLFVCSSEDSPHPVAALVLKNLGSCPPPPPKQSMCETDTDCGPPPNMCHAAGDFKTCCVDLGADGIMCPLTSNDQCDDHADCAEGLVCGESCFCEQILCRSDGGCPVGAACESGFCGGAMPAPCTDCVCDDCILQTGEECEPNAVPGGPGTCAEGFQCVGCACVPKPPDPPACGDLSCNGDETCDTCPADCGPCPVIKDYCPADCQTNLGLEGSGYCDQGEHYIGVVFLPDKYCMVSSPICPDLGIGFGFYCDDGNSPDGGGAGTGNAICQAALALGVSVTGSCVDGCCAVPAPPQ